MALLQVNRMSLLYSVEMYTISDSQMSIICTICDYLIKYFLFLKKTFSCLKIVLLTFGGVN